MKAKYKLHFRHTDFQILYIDLNFHSKAYGQIDYEIVYDGETVSGYLTEKGMKKAYQIGKRLLNKNFANKVITYLEDFSEKARQDILHKIEKNKSPIEQWKIIKKEIMELGSHYLYCEEPVLSPLEKLILEACPDRKIFVEIFKDPRLAKKFNFNQKETDALDTLIQLGKLKFSVHKNLGKIGAVAGMVGLVMKKYNINKKQAFMLRANELEKLLKRGEINKALLNERLGGCVILPSDKNSAWRIITGEKYKKIKKEIENSISFDIKGTVAYPGKARGIVKKNLSFVGGKQSFFDHILVCGMTNPQLVPYLKNVKAIVTDEGGITCHAAIISRELKVPCIVGTGNATQVLKDGDLVEVDADKGIVKIIKKSK